MVKEAIVKSFLTEVFQATPHLIRFPIKGLWIDYDKEGDVLYLSFRRPQKATDSEMLDNGVLLRYKGEKLVGVPYLRRQKGHSFT